jgi:hypothetical protein
MQAEIDRLEAASRQPPERPGLDLSESDRREIAQRWAQVVCTFCGGYHHGVCNRVRRVEIGPNGMPAVTEFWKTWEPNPRVIWPEDVWPSVSDMASELEHHAREERAKAEIQRTAQAEFQKAKRESERSPSPREILRDILPRPSGG